MKHVTTFAAAVFMLAASPAFAGMGDEAVGINTHVPAPDVVDLCAEAGLSWIRVDNNWLQTGDPCGDVDPFGPLDDSVEAATARGLNVFMTLAYTPPCASTGDADGKPNNDVPRADRWENYVRKTVQHYRSMGVRHFGLWNEPNLDGFWAGSASQYVDIIVVPGIRAIRDVCADCLALGPELANVGECDVWLEDIMTAMDAAGASFDIYTHHIYQGFDVAVYEGDSFVNALDRQRFAFTRRGFVDVMEDVGHAPNRVPDREVWITETGEKCEPPTGAGAMETQKEYYMSVLDEQLSRNWYTNTFFYEILDSRDELDGYGITRREDSGSGFLRKPAFTALKERIASDPRLQGDNTTECSDGRDNDADDQIDMDDPGCSSPQDDNEADHPEPAPEISAGPAPAVTLDGSLAEWASATWTSLASPDDFVGLDGHQSSGAADLSCRFAALWKQDHLFLGVEVTDDAHEDGASPETLWSADSLQVAFDVAGDGGHAYDGDDDFELGYALQGGSSVKYRTTAPAGAHADTSTVSVKRSGTKTVYEVRIPAVDIGKQRFSEGDSIKFSFLVNDSDGSGREGWVEWTPGIGLSKDPARFGTMRLIRPQGSDVDGDGVPSPTDCDDNDPSMFPGNPETCDGKDNDCDGSADNDLSESCYDGPDGTAGKGPCVNGTRTCANGVWSACNGQVIPKQEICGNLVDEDCNGADLDCSCPDADGDGHMASSCGGDDCDDNDGRRYPGANETCGDGKDSDCDGVDEPCGNGGSGGGSSGGGCATGFDIRLAGALLLLGLMPRKRRKRAAGS